MDPCIAFREKCLILFSFIHRKRAKTCALDNWTQVLEGEHELELLSFSDIEVSPPDIVSRDVESVSEEVCLLSCKVFFPDTPGDFFFFALSLCLAFRHVLHMFLRM